jgi:hypothetical protein
MRGTSIRAAVLVLLLIVAGLQCLARCSDTGARVPPCHRQESGTPSVCQVPVLLVKDTTPDLPSLEMAGAMAVPAALTATFNAESVEFAPLSPDLHDSIRPNVLRI